MIRLFSWLRWSAFEGLARQVLSSLFFFALATFLSPDDVGAFAIALAISQITHVFVDNALGEVLLQRPRSVDAEWNTAYWINLAIACLIAATAYLAIGSVSALFASADVGLALFWLCVAAVIGALGNLQRWRMAREFRFRSLALIALGAQIGGGGVAIAMASVGFGYEALAANIVVSVAISSVGYFIACDWKPRLQLSMPAAIEFARTAPSAGGLRLIAVLQAAMFPIAGLHASAAELGLLALAQRIVGSLQQVGAQVLNSAVLPMASRIQSQPAAFRVLALRLFHVFALVAAPMYAGITIVAPDLVVLVFGDRWAMSAEFMPLVVGVQGASLAILVIGCLMRALGRSWTFLRLTAPLLVVDAAIVYLTSAIDLKLMLLCLMARQIIALPIVLKALSKAADLRVPDVLRAVAGPAVAAGAMVLALLPLGEALSGQTALERVLVVTGVGALVYLLAVVALAHLVPPLWRTIHDDT